MYTALLVGGVPLAHQIHRLTNRNVKVGVVRGVACFHCQLLNSYLLQLPVD